MAASIADVGLLEAQLPKLLKLHKQDIQSAPLLLLDGNMPQQTILVCLPSSSSIHPNDVRTFLTNSRLTSNSLAMATGLCSAASDLGQHRYCHAPCWQTQTIFRVADETAGVLAETSQRSCIPLL